MWATLGHFGQAGKGSNILIDGSVTLASNTDSLPQALTDWVVGGAAPANVANIRSQLQVTFNSSNANRLWAGSGLDWFWATYSKDSINPRPTDLLN